MEARTASDTAVLLRLLKGPNNVGNYGPWARVHLPARCGCIKGAYGATGTDARCQCRGKNLRAPAVATCKTCWSLPTATTRPNGRMAERFIAAVLKTAEGASLPGVQIPLLPPN